MQITQTKKGVVLNITIALMDGITDSEISSLQCDDSSKLM